MTGVSAGRAKGGALPTELAAHEGDKQSAWAPSGLNAQTPVVNGLHGEVREDDADEADRRSDPSRRPPVDAS